MPRHVPCLLRWSPERAAYEFVVEGGPVTLVPAPEGRLPPDWLDGRASFAFQSRSGVRCTVRRESLRRGGAYWYAYRSLNGRTAKRYVGRTDALTVGRLEDVVARFADGLPEGGPAQAQPAPIVPSPAAPAVPAQPPSTVPLLASKLHPPRLPGTVVDRPRLLDRLEAGSAHKVTLLSAPAGFGKTTLVRQWIAARSRPDAAWVSLDAGDNDPARFWRYAITACRNACPAVGGSALAQLSPALQPPFDPPPLETVLAFFLNDLAQHMRDGLLVLEDYHAITEPRIHQTLAFFIDHLPPTIHVVLLARTEPPLPLTRWRAEGAVHELPAGDLRFLEEETAAFLRQTVPVPLPEKAMAQLGARLEGWAAGLRLLALRLQGLLTPRAIEQEIALLTGDGQAARAHQPIVEYFVGEVLQAQPEALQLFLLQTSVLGRLSGPLCDAVTGRHDSGVLLDAIERAGLFLESLDDAGQWYRYHALFAEAMRAEARRRLGADTLGALSLQASRWYEEHGLLAEAIDAALLAGESERVAVLIDRPDRRGQVREPHTLRHWLEQLPEHVRRAHPALCFDYAIALLFSCFPGPTTAEIRARVEEAVRMAEDGWRERNHLPGLGEVYAFRAMMLWRDGVAQAAPLARQALIWLSSGVPEREPAVENGVLEWYSVSQAVVASDAIQNGRFDEGRHLLLEAHQRSLDAGNRPFTRVTLLLRAAVCEAMGELHQADAYFRHILSDARDQNDTEDIAFALYSMAGLAYEWNDLDAAERLAGEVHDLGDIPGEPEAHEIVRLLQARLLHARGHTAMALQHNAAILARLHVLASPHAAQHIPDVLLWQARLHIAAGDLYGARRSLSILEARDGDMMAVQRHKRDIVAARLLLAQGEAREALRQLDALLAVAQERRHMRHELEIRVLTALAYAACMQPHEARQQLHEVLVRACAERYMRLFLDEGEPLAALLRSLLPSLREPALRAYARAILQVFAPAAHAPTPSPSSGALPVEPLSAQEQRVLQLLAAGRSNPEIARELVVSVNTVKDHVKSLYRKLNVRNRLEAAEAARRLRA